MNKNNKNLICVFLVICFVFSSCLPAFGLQTKNEKNFEGNNIIFTDEEITIVFSFSEPVVNDHSEYVTINVGETDFNHIADGSPVLPVKLIKEEFLFGTEIISVDYEISTTHTISLDKKISFGKCAPKGTEMDEVYNSDELFPSDWVTYHSGAGISDDQIRTFFVARVYPVRYSPLNDEISYIDEISVTISYKEPSSPILNPISDYELLIISPSSFKNKLQPLVNHKNDIGINTKIVELPEIYDQMSSDGRDDAEKIKYYIKWAIENWGVKYVLLVGAIKGQSWDWNLPVRYSHVVPPVEQEYPEGRFISDLYYADIYDSEGNFSSWDSNENDIFAEWNEDGRDIMDLYPDVYLGRLACRYGFEVTTMVNKIENYESDICSESWFKNVVLISGDSYNDTNHLNEGQLICDRAAEVLPGFNPEKLYASEEFDINKNTVKQAIDPGCGFVFFCGHGNPGTWNTHLPPDSEGWATGFNTFDMMFLNNKNKLPVAVIGGCHNSQFNTTVLNLFKNAQESIKRSLWMPRCWSWWFTCKVGGGAIANIGSTGLGTHGREDTDFNGIADYLEVLDGWLELRFLELYGIDNQKILGKNHGDAITEYLHIFLGANDKMDAKMVQQWVLFGDPSLEIGGHESLNLI